MNALITVDAALPGTPTTEKAPADAGGLCVRQANCHCTYGVVPTFTRIEAPAQRLWADIPSAGLGTGGVPLRLPGPRWAGSHWSPGWSVRSFLRGTDATGDG